MRAKEDAQAKLLEARRPPQENKVIILCFQCRAMKSRTIKIDGKLAEAAFHVSFASNDQRNMSTENHRTYPHTASRAVLIESL